MNAFFKMENRMTKSTEREQARQLRREQGMSVKKIAKQLGVAPSSVSNWVRDIPLTDEQRQHLEDNHYSYGAQHKGSIANREKHRKIRLTYQEAGRQKAREGNPLHLTGCMLYWAEGRKARDSCIFSNSDPDMMCVYISFLRECLGVPSQEIYMRVFTYLDNNLRLEEIEHYWLKLLDLPLECLKTSQVNQPTSSSQKGRKLLYGICELRVKNGTQYVQHIFGAIQEYMGIDKPEWLD